MGAGNVDAVAGGLTTRRGVVEDTETRVGIKTRGGYNQRCIIHSQ